jgi:branched-chain amino acid transport system ATP-binding protein
MLEVHALSAAYGQVEALFDVTLTVRPGELVVLQGLNGAGKSTLLKAIMGLLPLTQGSVTWQGHLMTHWPPYQRSQAGLGYVPEDRRLFTGLTVRENLMIVASSPPSKTALDLAAVLTLFPALAGMLDRPAGQMSGGEQQMLALGRTLMIGPQILLLDEPCEGIAPVLVEAMRDALLRLRSQGLPMLVAEQNQILASHADRLLTLVSGRLN